MKTRKLGAIGICAALALAAAPAMPAQAAVTGANGYLACPVGKTVWVSVVTEYSSPVTFYSGTAKLYTSGYSYTRVFNFGTSTVNWRVEAAGGIQTVSDFCEGNVNSPSE